MPSLDISVSITKITIVYIINTATVTSKISTTTLILYSPVNQKFKINILTNQIPPATQATNHSAPALSCRGELRMCRFWAGGISSFPFSRAREYRLLRRLNLILKKWFVN
jgi:hypothetical protein